MSRLSVSSPEEAGDDGMAAAPADDTTETKWSWCLPTTPPKLTRWRRRLPMNATGDRRSWRQLRLTKPWKRDNDVAMAPVDGETDGMETGAVDRTTLAGVDMGAISATTLIGTTVYGANEENVGSVNDIILSDGGDVEAVIVDVGGFLGLGAKEVAIGMDNLEFMSDGDASMYLYTQFTEEQLEAQPEYDETTYAEQRDDQLLIPPALTVAGNFPKGPRQSPRAFSVCHRSLF